MLRIFANWQHSHEPANTDIGIFYQFLISVLHIFKGKPAFGKFVADVYFDQTIGCPVCFFRTLLQFFCQIKAVERMDQITFPDQVFDFICAGAQGIGVASGICTAADPCIAAKEMIAAVRSAINYRD